MLRLGVGLALLLWLAASAHAATSFASELSLGGALRTLYQTPVGGGELNLAIGGERDVVAGYFTISTFVGATPLRLLTAQFQFGGLVQARLGRVRVGGGISIGAMVVRRVTTEDLIDSFVAGVFAQASVDLVTQPQPIFLVLRLGADTLWPSFVFDGFLGVGTRFH